MTDPEDSDDEELMRQLNDQLSGSLDRCRSILKDCRERLVEPPAEDDAAKPVGEAPPPPIAE
jgi:hypothetical protein